MSGVGTHMINTPHLSSASAVSCKVADGSLGSRWAENRSELDRRWTCGERVALRR